MNEQIVELLNKTFAEDKDVYGVVLYALAVMRGNQAMAKGFATNALELTGLSPSELDTIRKYDNGFITNKFYQENFAPVKAQLALNDIKFRTMGYMMTYHLNKEKTPRFVAASKSIMMTYLDVFTTIAMLWKGVEFAEHFDVELRRVYELSEQQQKFFKDNE